MRRTVIVRCQLDVQELAQETDCQLWAAKKAPSFCRCMQEMLWGRLEEAKGQSVAAQKLQKDLPMQGVVLMCVV